MRITAIRIVPTTVSIIILPTVYARSVMIFVFLLCVCAYLNVLFKLCAFLIRSNEHIDDKSDKS